MTRPLSKDLQISGLCYPRAVPETAGAGIGVPNCTRRTAASRGIFCVRLAFARPFPWAGLGGGAFGLTGTLVRRHANPTLCPPTPIGVGRRVSNPALGGRQMRANAHARPEQTTLPQILAIVRAAMRDAVNAPTDRASLDVAGKALVAIAELARLEARA